MKRLLLLIALLSFSFGGIRLKPIGHLAILTFSSGYLYSTTDTFFDAEVHPIRNDLIQHFTGGVCLGSFGAIFLDDNDSDVFAILTILGWESLWFITSGTKIDLWDIGVGLAGYYSYKGLFNLEVSKDEVRYNFINIKF